jgi:hypothetical protein
MGVAARADEKATLKIKAATETIFGADRTMDRVS